MSDPNRIRILLVEDNATDVLLIDEAFGDLSDFGYELTHAERLADGLARARESQFDIVILDLALPDSNRTDTFWTFHRQAPDLPVLVLTGWDDIDTGLRALRDGAQDYLIKKEIYPALLGRAIRYAIERHALGRALERSRDRMRMLAIRQQEILEAERTRISREVHDELGQKLSAMKLDLHWLDSRLQRSLDGGDVETTRARIAEDIELADQLMQVVQRVAIELRPSSLDHLGLADAIRDESRRFEARTAIRMDLRLSSEMESVARDVATALFRIYQELISNVARHARAREVAVTFETEDGFHVLEVSDDGIGMPPGAENELTSLGLLGVQERAAAHRGRVNFESRTGTGTRVAVRIPAEAAGSIPC